MKVLLPDSQQQKGKTNLLLEVISILASLKSLTEWWVKAIHWSRDQCLLLKSGPGNPDISLNAHCTHLALM